MAVEAEADVVATEAVVDAVVDVAVAGFWSDEAAEREAAVWGAGTGTQCGGSGASSSSILVW